MGAFFAPEDRALAAAKLLLDEGERFW